ncbi:hypothetical protein BKA93DRAFT_820868 [Sparassis latifolia]
MAILHNNYLDEDWENIMHNQRHHTHAAATVTTLQDSDNEGPSIISHPVVAVMASSSFLFAMASTNHSTVFTPNSDDSESSVEENIVDAEMSSLAVDEPPVVDASVSTSAPLHADHLFWCCKTSGPALDFSFTFNALIDHGSQTVLIHDDYVRQLSLRWHKLPVPKFIEMAMADGDKKVVIKLSEYIRLSLHDPSSHWSARTVHAIIAPGLCSPVILGLPFLSHNCIVIDHELRTTVNKDTSFDLLNLHLFNETSPSMLRTTLKERF